MAENEATSRTPQQSGEDHDDQSGDSGSETEQHDEETMTASERHADAANQLGTPAEAPAVSQRRRPRQPEGSSNDKEESGWTVCNR